MFASAAYRIGHTLVSDQLLLDGGYVTLSDAFNNPSIVTEYGIAILCSNSRIRKNI